jgi:hypothetical protein
MKPTKIARTLGLAFICFCACLGLTQSNFQVFSLSVPEYPWPWDEYPTSDFGLWDYEATLEELGENNLYNWQSIMDFAEANSNEMQQLTYDWEMIRSFAERNVFALTIPGSTVNWKLSFWDLDLFLDDDYNREFPRPNALALKHMILDKGNEKVKQQVLKLLVNLLKDEATKAKWEAAKAEFIEYNDYALESDEDAVVEAFKAISSSTYEKAVSGAIDYYLNVLGQVNHNNKAMLSKHRNWIMTSITGEYCNFLFDQSAFKFHSLAYRMGPEAATQLKTYLNQAKTELTKKG